MSLLLGSTAAGVPEVKADDQDKADARLGQRSSTRGRSPAAISYAREMAVRIAASRPNRSPDQNSCIVLQLCRVDSGCAALTPGEHTEVYWKIVHDLSSTCKTRERRRGASARFQDAARELRSTVSATIWWVWQGCLTFRSPTAL